MAFECLLESRVLWQEKEGDLDKKCSVFWQQPVPLFGYNMKNWVIKGCSYTVQLRAHFWLRLELQKLQWLLRKEILAFLLIHGNIPGREPMCRFKYPLEVQGAGIFPSPNASSSLFGMCAKVFPPRMAHIKCFIPGLALSSFPSSGVSALSFIPVSHFPAPWKEMPWKALPSPPPSVCALMWNETFSWLDVERETAIPAWGILMSRFFPNLGAAQCAHHYSLESGGVQGASPTEMTTDLKKSKLEPIGWKIEVLSE